MAFLGGSDNKESACNAGDLGSIPKSGRSPGEVNGSPHQYCCLENSMDRGAWWAKVHGVAELDVTEQLTHTHTKKGWGVVGREAQEGGDICITIADSRCCIAEINTTL